MRYHDLPDEAELAAYARTFNQRAQQLGRAALGLDVLRGVILESGGVCGWCGISLLKQPFELDHIVALADHGAHTAQNLVVCCPACNRRKAALPPLRFALELVAAHGYVSPTIQRVLDHYGAQASVQRHLFE